MERITREREAVRPVETAGARLRWLLDMEGQFSDEVENLVLERVDYRNQDRYVVVADILREAGVH